MVIPLAFAATGATLLVKGLDDLSLRKEQEGGILTRPAMPSATARRAL